MADELRTKRLLLRRARLDDAPAMHAIMSDAQAMRYWSTMPHATLAETERWMESMVTVDPATSDDFIITLDGALIGKLGAWQLPEVGFLIAPQHMGKGYASEALAAFIARRRGMGPSGTHRGCRSAQSSVAQASPAPWLRRIWPRRRVVADRR